MNKVNGTPQKSSGMRHDIRTLEAQLAQLQEHNRQLIANVFQLQQAFTALHAGLGRRKVGIWPFRRPVLSIRDMEEALHELKERKTREQAAEEGEEVDTTPIPSAPDPGPIQRYVEAIEEVEAAQPPNGHVGDE